jgi:hypothetical protein
LYTKKFVFPLCRQLGIGSFETNEVFLGDAHFRAERSMFVSLFDKKMQFEAPHDMSGAIYLTSTKAELEKMTTIGKTHNRGALPPKWALKMSPNIEKTIWGKECVCRQQSAQKRLSQG